MRKLIFALALLSTSAAWGQEATPTSSPSDYLGPEVLSRGAGSIGQRTGKDADLRFYGNASGIYDTGLRPVSVDSNGKLVDSGGLFGIEAGFGAYGKHSFRHSQLGLDYSGSYRAYQEHQYYNGINQQLNLGYTWQKTRRVLFNFQGNAGTSAYADSMTLGVPAADGAVVDSTSLLFDNRTNYFGTNLSMTYIASQRTSYTVGGNFNRIFRQSDALVGLLGYGAQGSVEHRFSPRTSVGLSYQRMHFEFPGSFGGSDTDTYLASYNRRFGRPWVLSVSAGIYRSEVAGLSQINLEPAVAILLGVSKVAVPFYTVNYVPSGKASLQRYFRNAVWSLNYSRMVSPGNGVYLTSRWQRAETGFSYSGIRKWSFAARGGYDSLNSLGQTLMAYRQFEGGVEATYSLTKALHISAGFSQRRQDVDLAAFDRTSKRTTLSLIYSPGNIPISFR